MGKPAHMHMMPHNMDSIFAVHREPGTSKPMKYSIQFYDHEGIPALKIFLTQDRESKKYREDDMAIFSGIKELYIKE
jgi:putative heme degradation protein